MAPAATLRSWALAGWLCGLAPVFAGDAPLQIAPSDPAAIATNKFDFVGYIDRMHATICSRVIGFGLGMDAYLAESFRKPPPQAKTGRIDQFVSDRRLEDDDPGTRLKFSTILKLRDAEGPDVGLRINGKLRLPRFEDRVALVLSSIDEDDTLLDELDRSQTVRSGSDREGTASVRYYIKETRNFKASVDAGLRFHPEPDPRLKLRLRFHHDFERVTTRFTQSFFWESIDGFGEKSQFDIDQQVPRAYLRRLTTSVLWSEDSDGVEAGQSFSYYKYLSNRRVIGARVGLAGVLEPNMRMDNYTARLIYRKRVHRNWIYLEIEPGVDFPRDRDFQATGFVNVKLDIIFGDWEDE